MDGFQLQQISISDPSFLAALEACGLSSMGLERAESYALVERDTGERVGYGALEIYAPHAMLRSLATPEDHRGQGFASTLCRHLFAQAAARGVTHLYALTETAPGFFEHMGFEPMSRDMLPSQVMGSTLVSEVCGKQADVFKLSL